MSVLSKAIAHVSFPGGGMFLPARSPYDRQILVEHIADRVRSKGHVQVLLDEQRWMVHLNRGAGRTCCSHCGDTGDSACYRTPEDGVAYCLTCALGTVSKPTPLYHIQQRHAG
jgi:late competence protein required for DNA uptake (superfamily II DNA/RNA helicase)